MRLPAPRGPVTALIFEHLTRRPHAFDPSSVCSGEPAVEDEDLQLALFVCYELHYRGFDGVDDDWEWNPSLLEARQVLERRFEDGLAEAVPRPVLTPSVPMRRVLAELVAAAGEDPSLAAFLERKADLGQFREFVVHRSIYHLKEADPHTWAIPRLHGGAKAALVEIQADEYGGGRLERMHSELFRATMRKLDLDDSYGAYLGRIPAITLAVGNVMSLFGLHRRRRGALLGHLAAFEMTSSLPNLRYGHGLRRLGGDATACRFYDEHVRADAVHEQVAAHDMCGGFAAAHPDLAGDVLYGAACALALDRLFTGHVLDRWTRGATSLRGADLAVGSR
ncbi:iron-containing redox enzyme family protein [Streptosporangium sp. NBC_01756]|uniref:iron-containing redox enzyme family protein n=1 Tax=Streptosporangium sp. NBC_01756 TaxID=2975950 RepID=UPI002DD9F4E1|nr:iron-containing redox enzyme family protein [Streptosporangium sp. NBC_01756]WSC84376.1 iron-containing redox enzyme family protein [Streptosporangium sp. NBC_01756]